MTPSPQQPPPAPPSPLQPAAWVQHLPARPPLDLPPALAGAARAQYQPLVDWLAARQVQLLLLGSRRDDLQLEVS